MQEFSVQSAGFAALTLSDLMLQQLVISGHFTSAQARLLLASAIERHTDCAERDPDNAALNITTAQLIQRLTVGLEPLLDQYDRADARGEKPPRAPSGKVTLLPVGPAKKTPMIPAAAAPLGGEVFAPADAVRQK